MEFRGVSIKKYFFLLLFLKGSLLFGFSPSLAEVDKGSPPPRIIRPCCVLGADFQLMGIPFSKVNHIMSPGDLNNHSYMGGKKEGNGIIYTKKGGFIDIGHLRDQADWTRYLFSLILTELSNGEFIKKLKHEGGSKYLTINATELDTMDCLLLAGKITFDLSLWHELSTWFGASTLPFVSERYSSFSLEDVYSNLLGIYIGMEALKSDLPYESAMTQAIYQTLDSLGAQSEAETAVAMESVREIWWSRSKRIPNSKVLLVRDTDVYSTVSPWLVSDTTSQSVEPHLLLVPRITSIGNIITDYYTLNIDLNNKFPAEEMFPERETRIISQDDFKVLLNRVEEEIENNKLVDSGNEVFPPLKPEKSLQY